MALSGTDHELRRAIEGLQTLIDQLHSGQLKLLFARTGDAEWSDGAENMMRYYKQLLSLLSAIRTERIEQRKARLRRRKARLGGSGAEPAKTAVRKPPR